MSSTGNSTSNTSSSAFTPWLSASQRITTDVVGGKFSVGNFEDHLNAAVEWMERAHDQGDDDGVSYGFCLRGPDLKNIGVLGWRPSYLETSGYIIETFYDLADRADNEKYRERAEAIARWLLTVQNDDGSFSNPQYGGGGIVFDTGQDLFGLVRAYRETKDEVFLVAAQRAAQWLADSLDEDGAWRRNTHLNCIHTYNTRCAWAMLELNDAHPDSDIRDAACRNLDWAITQQQENGFFNNCAFEPGLPPFTHTIAYAIRGFVEAGRLLDSDKYYAVAQKAADRMTEYVSWNGHIPGRISVTGEPRSTSCCLTGNCQMAIIWYYLAERSNDKASLSAARKSLEFVMSVQDIKTSDKNVNGAIKGSHPIWGKYTPLAYPNWATKFFIEAMLLKEKAEATA